ncbi:MAG TPA: PLP-dependent aminotransferase family protein [Nocardioidaceae bacterium]|nr:PLP-dependent aminotransferase family protein [Nocardioidaceae bacterium]
MARTMSAARLRTLLGSSLDRSPAYLALADGVRMLISDGRIVAGTRLPSERELTSALGLSRTTVTRAYAVLRERGYVVSRQGSGSVVHLPAQQGGSRDPLLSPDDVPDGTIDLTCAASSAPPGVAAAYERAVGQLPSFLTGAGYFPSGVPALKEAIARRYTERGLATSPDQVVVTCGALAAAAVVVRALTSVGDRVLVESPSYPNALGTITRSGARVVGAGVDPSGWDPGTWVSTVRSVRPAAAYLVPDFQNPTGRLMPEDQRDRLATALERGRTVPVVDETLVEMALDPVEMPRPFAAFAADTVTVGSASKAFWGGLRIGWIRAPHDRVGALVRSRLTLDLGAPLLEQLVLCELMSGHEAVLEHHREQLRASRAALTDALAKRLPDWHFLVPSGGLALWCELPSPHSSALSTTAERHGLLLPAGPSFAPEGGLERFVRIPYTQRPEVLVEAVDRLATAWEQAREHRGTTTGRRSPLVA